MVLFIVRESRQGWQNYINRLKNEGIFQKCKKGQEEDVESRQLSLAGAVEVTK